ncbi:ThiF family adenylyltransferase [Hyphomonas sp. WL0036]|uniref:HesA/MoeB/ThiF family protein n=1 Tax=Hyphomonas sediminis TaxID=2866160 RepID=UPI001C7FE2EB|nr:ThiF family adenylyltransferase [Hyphomonas sediminis]MBY9066056.1 ThiF family adenylyltransferase [Hyphomonas sediminis]
MSLTPEELDRHRRHILLKEIGGPGVAKLRTADVSIIGAGALGGPAALYLAAAGVGSIELWDDDRIERSNLQRQIQFTERQIGAEKAASLAARINAIDPSIRVKVVTARFGEGGAPSGTILIDATDNFETRFALNAFAHAEKRYLVSGAASGWTGQVSVFASGVDAEAPCYRCWIAEMPPAAQACDEVGVVGAITGMTGSAMALETVKLITGAGKPLIGRLLLMDGLNAEMRTVRLRRDSQCPVCSG